MQKLYKAGLDDSRDIHSREVSKRHQDMGWQRDTWASKTVRKSDTSLIGPPTFQRTGSDLLLENKLSRDLDLIGPKEWELRVEAPKPPAAVIGARPDYGASVLFYTNSHKFDNFV